MPTKQQELVVKVTADAAEATKAIAGLGKAAKPLEDGIKVPVKLDGADKAADQLEAAAKAGTDLASSLDKTDGTKVATVAGDADKASAALKEVADDAERAGRAVGDVGKGGGAGLDEVGAGAGRTKEQMDTLERSASGTKNAFANLVGNTAQDLGELAGPLGSVGVALGQVAEYTADAANEGGGLKAALAGAATAAGPMLALAAAGLAVNKVIGDMQRNSQEAKQANEALLDSFVEGTGILDSWGRTLDEAFSAGTADQVQSFNKLIKDALKTTGDLDKTAVAMGELGLSLDDMGASVKDADKDFVGWASSLLEAQGFLPQAARDIAEVVSANDKLSGALAVVNTNAEKNALSKWITPEQKANLDNYVRGLSQLSDVAEKTDLEKKARETNDLSRASADFIDIVDRGRAAGESELQIAQEVTAEQSKQAQAREENARAAEEGAKRTQEAGSILEQVGRQVATAEQAAADAADNARRAQEQWMFGTVDAQAEIDQVTSAISRYKDQMDAQTKAAAEGTQTTQEKIESDIALRDAMANVVHESADVINSYKDQGLTADQARQKQSELAQQQYALAIAMGFPEDAAAAIRDRINEIPPAVNTNVQITEQGYQDVKGKKNELEKDMESTLFIYGVLDRSVLNAINSLPPGSIPRSVVPATSTAVTPGGLAVAPASVVPVAAPMAAPSHSSSTRTVAVNVNVSAGVVADSFQLQRVVERAVRSGARLGGRRP